MNYHIKEIYLTLQREKREKKGEGKVVDNMGMVRPSP